MKNTFAFLLLAFTLVSCLKKDVQPDEPKYNNSELVVSLNLKYGNDPMNVMDMYLPANRSTATTKTIVLMHGGAWSEGDKMDEYFSPVVAYVRQMLPDWAVFNLNYRLANVSGVNLFPSQEEDVKAAVKYILDRRQAFGISDKWVIGGESAGGHLSLLQAFKNSESLKPKAVIDFYGPTDMTGIYNFYHNTDVSVADLISILMKGTPTSNAMLYSSSSPINYINSKTPPTIILQGGKDDIVPKEQSEMLRDKLTAAGVTNQYVFYPDRGHGWYDPATVDDAFAKVDAFLKANVK